MVSNLIQVAKNEKQQIIKLILVVSMAFFVLIVGWNKITKTTSYHSFYVAYNDFTAKIVTNIGGVFYNEIKYKTETKLLIANTKSTKLIVPINAYKYFFAGFILLALVPLKHWKSSVSIIIFVFLFVALRTALISYIMLIYRGTLHIILLLWLEPIIIISMLVLTLYIIQHNDLLKRIFSELENRFTVVLTTSLTKLLFFLIIIPPLPRVIFTYIHSDLMPGIVSFILFFSKLFIFLMGKTAIVSGRIISLESNWVDLEYPCIGLGVYSIVAILILAIKGKIKNKIIYLTVFAFIYLVLNALRLSVLLVYINKTFHEIGLNKLELHNNATYFMYLVAFGGFLGYNFLNTKKVV